MIRDDNDEFDHIQIRGDTMFDDSDDRDNYPHDASKMRVRCGTMHDATGPFKTVAVVILEMLSTIVASIVLILQNMSMPLDFRNCE